MTNLQQFNREKHELKVIQIQANRELSGDEKMILYSIMRYYNTGEFIDLNNILETGTKISPEDFKIAIETLMEKQYIHYKKEKVGGGNQHNILYNVERLMEMGYIVEIK